jgi:hypothetical protein
LQPSYEQRTLSGEAEQLETVVAPALRARLRSAASALRTVMHDYTRLLKVRLCSAAVITTTTAATTTTVPSPLWQEFITYLWWRALMLGAFVSRCV